MPSIQLPPTPSTSTDIAAKQNSPTNAMESVFSLPPPAWQPHATKTSKEDNQVSMKENSPPPSPPNNKQVRSKTQRKRTLSGSTKFKVEPPTPPFTANDASLPPPPSRARKIIQMKPKPIRSNTSEDQAQPATKATPASKEPVSSTASSTKRKQTQPTATSAAGRKIARKTAHSIIERRRRSKMNEEFGVLKDMIPACTGVEMHKLAILQAGIEYLRYLEGCIEQLKAQNEGQVSTKSNSHQNCLQDDDDNNEDEEDDAMNIDQTTQQHPSRQAVSSMPSESDSSSPSMTMRLPAPQHQQPLAPYRQSSITTSTSNSTFASPNLRPVQSSTSVNAASFYQNSAAQSYPSSSRTLNDTEYSVHPPSQTGVSPAFGAINFSPDLSRTTTWSSINGPTASSKPSPNILPLPHSAMLLSDTRFITPHSFEPSEGQAEATATAALMMMTKDRRGSIGTTRTGASKGMSVRDLLAS